MKKQKIDQLLSKLCSGNERDYHVVVAIRKYLENPHARFAPTFYNMLKTELLHAAVDGRHRDVDRRRIEAVKALAALGGPDMIATLEDLNAEERSGAVQEALEQGIKHLKSVRLESVNVLIRTEKRFNVYVSTGGSDVAS